jgi:transcription termination factor Rho
VSTGERQRPGVSARLFEAGAADIERSGTRREELLLPTDDLRRLWLLCKVLTDRRPGEAMDLLLNRLRKTASNAKFLQSLSP